MFVGESEIEREREKFRCLRANAIYVYYKKLFKYSLYVFLFCVFRATLIELHALGFMYKNYVIDIKLKFDKLRTKKCWH